MRSRIPAALFLLSLITANEALRVLVSFPAASKSHGILGRGVTDRLLEAGHEVVHLTSYPKEKPVPRLTEINMSSVAKVGPDSSNSDDEFKLKDIINWNLDISPLIFYFSFTMHKKILTEPSLVKFLSDPKEKFDVVVLEWFFSEVTVGLPALFDAPFIWVCSTEPHWQVLRLVGDIPNPAYNVELASFYRPPLTFLQRAAQFWSVSIRYAFYSLIAAPIENWLYNRVYYDIAAKRGVTIPSYSEAKYNASMLFINSHPSVGGSMNLPQNAVSLAGYHIEEKVAPLPKDLQTLMDGAKHGVIYFSLGTNIKSDGMSEEMKRSILKIFSKLKQVVIWKFESDMADVPANVHLVKWAPQKSILAHPNLTLFITHGGLLSTTEAVYYGIPLVGTPIMADQRINMVSVEEKGFGIKVTLAEDMADEFEAAIKKVLTDPSYKIKAKEISAIYHDRPMKPGDELVFWVQHVARTHGAKHLRSPALSVSLFQKLYLDLLALVIVVTVLVYKLVKYLQSLRSKKQSKKIPKNKKE